MSNISYSNLQTDDTFKRNQFKKQLDDFATFKWRDIDMYENFGAFIINDKGGSLKFYNGPSYSNEYSKPAFQSSTGNLLGVSFSTYSISFKIGVYWISEEDQRRLMNWLDPFEIHNLSFSYDTHYRYVVKLAGREDSPRQIIGYSGKEPRYYTEMSLKFEIQGEPVARGQVKYKYDKQEDDNSYNYKVDKTISDYIDTDLATPVLVTCTFTPTENNAQMVLRVHGDGIESELFVLDLTNLPYYDNVNAEDEARQFYIVYDSETGLVYWKNGNDTLKLLTLLSSNTSGDRIVQLLRTNKFKIQGKFDLNRAYDSAGDIWFSFEGLDGIADFNASFEVYPLTNLI